MIDAPVYKQVSRSRVQMHLSSHAVWLIAGAQGTGKGRGCRHDDPAPMTNPQIPAWTKAGDVHIAACPHTYRMNMQKEPAGPRVWLRQANACLSVTLRPGVMLDVVQQDLAPLVAQRHEFPSRIERHVCHPRKRRRRCWPVSESRRRGEVVLPSAMFSQIAPTRLTALTMLFLVFDAVKSSSDEGWNAVDTIGVVRCSSDLTGVGRMYCDGSGVAAMREDEA